MVPEDPRADETAVSCVLLFLDSSNDFNVSFKEMEKYVGVKLLLYVVFTNHAFSPEFRAAVTLC